MSTPISHSDHHDLPPTTTPSSQSNDQTYWFPDGSLILSLHNARFKLHKSVVTRHSPYLSSLTPSAQEDGTDVIAVPSDRVGLRDFQALLGHLYHDAPLESASLAGVCAVLRATTPSALDFPSIYAVARTRFERVVRGEPDDVDAGIGALKGVGEEDAEGALALAIAHNITSAQKRLYYTVATTSHFDGTPHPHLSRTTTTTCTALQSSLIAHFTPILFTVATAGHMACTDVFAETWMELVIGPALADSGLCRPVEALRGIKEVKWEERGVCESCCGEKRAEWEEEARGVWERVDAWLVEAQVEGK